MAQLHEGTFRVPGGFNIQNNVPADDRTVTATLADLYSTLPNIYAGMTVAVAAEGYALYRWNGNDRTQAANWIAVAGEGEKGEKGDQGDIGLTGLTGAAGAKGDTGEKGDQGDAGLQGIQGEKGDQGDIGLTGLTGAAGAKGDTGEKGDQGDAGLTGPQGDKGDQGDAGLQGIQGEKGDQGDAGLQGIQGDKGDTGEGVIVGGTTGQILAKSTNADYDTEWVDGATGGGATKYLLRLEYDINEALINGQGSFITDAGFAAGATIDSYTVGTGSSGHFVTLSFANESTPPAAIFAYAWQPATGAYKITHYDNDDTAAVVYNTAIGDFSNQSTNEGGSGNDGQWAADVSSLFTGDFGSYGITLPVEQSILKYANAVPGGFGTPDKLPHVYIILIF